MFTIELELAVAKILGERRDALQPKPTTIGAGKRRTVTFHFPPSTGDTTREGASATTGLLLMSLDHVV